VPGRRELRRQGETFKVEYLYYVLLVLGLLAGCLFALKIPGRNRLARKPEVLADRTRQRHQREKRKADAGHLDLEHRHAVLVRELKQVRTPWGWPGSEPHATEGLNRGKHVSGEIVHQGALRRWVEHLVAEKQTIQDANYVQRREASLRALLEDRYGRAVKPSEMAYGKVKPPRLRDPNEPHDQMDNFPSGKTDKIVSGLDRQPGATESSREAPRRKTGSLKDLKTPWGW
jgi:hypothetical protein